MSAATATIITGAAIAASTAGSVYAAKKGASTAKEAAKTQSDSADKALDLQKSMYEQQQANLSPYRQVGQGSLQNLGNFQSFAGVPGQFGAGVQSQYQHALSPGMGAPGAVSSGGQPGGPSAPPAIVPHVSPADRGGIFHPQPTGDTAVPRANGQMVQMRAPTGEVMPVPADQVAHYTERGAQVIG